MEAVGTAARPGMMVGHAVEVPVTVQAATQRLQRAENDRAGRVDTEEIIRLVLILNDLVLYGTLQAGPSPGTKELSCRSQ
jgi:hypothetical protein